MTTSNSATLKVDPNQPVASTDLIALAEQHSEMDADGELQEQRFRRFGDGAGAHVWAETEIIAPSAGGSVVRVAILRGSAKGPKTNGTKIAEYEVIRTARCKDAAAAAPADPVAPVVTADAAAVSASPDQSTADIRRRQIVEGACEVISRKGYAEASVREIAEAAGVSIPSLYQYVKSKEDILFLITEGCMQRLFDEFRETIGAALSADAKIEKAVADYLAYISDNRRYINLVYRETRALSPENRARIFDIERSLMKEWEKIIVAGTNSGAFRPIEPALASNILYFSCSVWALRHWAIGEHGEAQVRKALTGMLLDGLRT